VLVVPADKALIASLAENCFHVPMHPADEFAAFARLLAQGNSVEDVAAAFGVTPLIVKRRMKLATVSPQLMALYREGGIGLDCLMVVAADAKLTHCAEVNLTHLGEADGLLAVDVDPGASSGDTSDGPQGRGCAGDRAAVGLRAQHRAPVPA
jgi:hypothetical protein